jgi:hypothetical protein
MLKSILSPLYLKIILSENSKLKSNLTNNFINIYSKDLILDNFKIDYF